MPAPTEMTAPTELDQAKAKTFAGTLVGHLNSAATILCTSVGHHVGLFDTMAGMEPASSAEIAKAAGLTERYVREWLNGMVVAGIIEYDPTNQTYRLPLEHAASTTSAAGPGNLAFMAQLIPLLAGVEDELITAFREGGGVPYSSFPKFTTLMASGSARRFDHNLVRAQVPLVPGIVERLEKGIDVADLGCGSGHAVNLMSREWPNSRFVGYDFSGEAIAEARREAAEWGLSNASFEVQDASKIAGEARFDLITTFDAVHDQANPAGFLETAARLLRPDGAYLCADFAASTDVAKNTDHPLSPFIYGASLFHCVTVSLAQGGEGLGAMWGEEKALEMLHNAGFTNVEVKRVEGDILNNYYIATKG
jgi:ubiquinone/menaquinone biosynthesis C-methylase UbiE